MFKVAVYVDWSYLYIAYLGESWRKLVIYNNLILNMAQSSKKLIVDLQKMLLTEFEPVTQGSLTFVLPVSYIFLAHKFH